MEATDVTLDMLSILLYAALGFLAGAAVSVLITVTVRVLMRHRPGMKFVSQRLKLPQRIFLTLLGTGIAIYLVLEARAEPPRWQPAFMQFFLIALILSGAYLLTGLIQAGADSYLARAQGDEETPHFRRIRTQLQIISKVAIAVVWVCAIAGALLTFPSLRAVGTSLFASAGVLSIVVGLAAQSSLSNVFAGMQLAFSDAIRVGDLIVFETNNGSIEEITLTYVVVRSWDDRRWIVPSTYFTSTPFENWTKKEAKLLGTVELDLDWLVPLEAMRVELMRLLRSSELWDGRSCALQVTDAIGGHVRVRALMSAQNSADLWDLRCYVREELISWLQHSAVYALPRTRLEPETTTAPPADERAGFIQEAVKTWEQEQSSLEPLASPPATPPQEPEQARQQRLRAWLDKFRARKSAHNPAANSQSAESRLYSGSPEAEERRHQLAGPSAADIAERKAAEERRQAPNQPSAADDEDKPQDH